jgi:signal transduction histidine kinase
MTSLPPDLGTDLGEENARLTRELRAARDRQTATSDILRVISQSPTDVQPVFETIVRTAARLLRCDRSLILRCDSTSYWTAASAGPEGPLPILEHGKVPIDPEANFPSRAIVEQKTLHLPDWSLIDLPEHERRIHQELGINSSLFLPLLREGECIGLLAMTGKRAGLFGESEIALAESFRDQALIAIENVRLFDETNEALERQTATAEILKVIASSPSDLQPVFEAIATSSNRLIGGFSTAVLRFIDDELHLAAFTPTNAKADETLKASFPRPLSEFPPFMLVRDGETQQFVDTESEDVSPLLRDIARLRGYRSMLFTPVMSNAKPIGIISVTRKEPGTFAAHHIQLVRTFADQAVIAIENVRLFDEVQARTRELAASLDDLRTAQDRLVQTEKLASLGQLTAGIAHEIKNPLNFVNNFSALSAELTDELNDVLKPAALDNKTRKEVNELTHMLKGNLEKVVQHGKRADSIVKNMLLHSREGSGEHRPADINALVDESLNLAYHGARAERQGFNVTLQRDFDPAAGMVELFPQEITRVFLNLISNGFYAVTRRKMEIGNSGFEPTVRATTRNLGHAVEIRIRDNGTGIPAEVKERMFNPFFTTKPAGEGTGLGLSMSHDIVVKQHGGSIDVETEPGQFTEFTVVLPRTSNQSGKNNQSDKNRGQP